MVEVQLVCVGAEEQLASEVAEAQLACVVVVVE